MQDTLSFFKHMLKYPTGTMELINKIGEQQPKILEGFFKKVEKQNGYIYEHMVLDMMVEFEDFLTKKYAVKAEAKEEKADADVIELEVEDVKNSNFEN